MKYERANHVTFTSFKMIRCWGYFRLNLMSIWNTNTLFKVVSPKRLLTYLVSRAEVAGTTQLQGKVNR